MHDFGLPGAALGDGGSSSRSSSSSGERAIGRVHAETVDAAADADPDEPLTKASLRAELERFAQGSLLAELRAVRDDVLRACGAEVQRLESLGGDGSSPLLPPRGGAADAAAPEVDAAPSSHLFDLRPITPDAPAPLLPLAPTLALICQLLHGQPVPETVARPLGRTSSLLSGFESPERHLELALSLHTDQASARSLASSLEAALRALVALCESRALPHKSPPLKAVLAQWQRDVEGFADMCREAWELHFYLVFVELKGDCALLGQTIIELMTKFDSSVDGLVSCLSRTASWVEDAFDALAAQENPELLRQRHIHALQQWRAQWWHRRVQWLPEAERRRFSCAPHDSGLWFWDTYFGDTLCVSWADFIEAFEDFYFLGLFPTDIMAQLRHHVDPERNHQVAQKALLSLLERHGAPADLVDTLLGEVLGSISSWIYREKPLALYRSSVGDKLASPPSAPSHLAGPPSGRKPPGHKKRQWGGPGTLLGEEQALAEWNTGGAAAPAAGGAAFSRPGGAAAAAAGLALPALTSQPALAADSPPGWPYVVVFLGVFAAVFVLPNVVFKGR